MVAGNALSCQTQCMYPENLDAFYGEGDLWNKYGQAGKFQCGAWSFEQATFRCHLIPWTSTAAGGSAVFKGEKKPDPKTLSGLTVQENGLIITPHKFL